MCVLTRLDGRLDGAQDTSHHGAQVKRVQDFATDDGPHRQAVDQWKLEWPFQLNQSHATGGLCRGFHAIVPALGFDHNRCSSCCTTTAWHRCRVRSTLFLLDDSGGGGGRTALVLFGMTSVQLLLAFLQIARDAKRGLEHIVLLHWAHNVQQTFDTGRQRRRVTGHGHFFLPFDNGRVFVLVLFLRRLFGCCRCRRRCLGLALGLVLGLARCCSWFAQCVQQLGRTGSTCRATTTDNGTTAVWAWAFAPGRALVAHFGVAIGTAHKVHT